jgi:large subunit ribosomal protein L1
MPTKTKRLQEIDTIIGEDKTYAIDEAIELLKKCPKVKFDQSIELSFKTGVDTKKSDQQIRGTLSLPNSTGKEVVLVVIAKGDKIKEANEAGADYAGSEEILDKIKGGWTDFTALIATPDMMREVGKLGKVLGPRGLMPSPKAGTVTNDVATAVKEVKAGKIEFKADKSGVVHGMIGKLSHETAKIKENILALAQAIMRAKPASAKGVYIESIVLTSTMGPGLKLDVNAVVTG